MRLLVFEFITGGGLANQPLPPSLLQEGYLMRNALLTDLCELASIELLVLQDARIKVSTANEFTCCQWLKVGSDMDLKTELLGLASKYDAVWLIAPETDGILAGWCQFFDRQGKQLCTSGYQAAKLCGDKLQTVKVLQQAGIACVPSREYSLSEPFEAGDWVLKNNHSVGCEQVYLLRSESHWSLVQPQLDVTRRYLLQPYIQGKALSLSCLFFQGNAYYICCNEQHLDVIEQQFVLVACTVNVHAEKAESYQQLCQAIAVAIPYLFGYAGIDFIETARGEMLVLEINPRLTSSYVGIKAALGINVAAQLMNMLNQRSPHLTNTQHQEIRINMNQGVTNAG